MRDAGCAGPVANAAGPMVKDEVGAGRINVVLNWFAELKRLAPAK